MVRTTSFKHVTKFFHHLFCIKYLYLFLEIFADDLELQCRVLMKPYDICGAWYSDQHFLSGDVHRLGHLVSQSVLWLNKASQETASEHIPIMNQMFRFYNGNGSSLRAAMFAYCPESECDNSLTYCNDVKSLSSNISEKSNAQHQYTIPLKESLNARFAFLLIILSFVFKCFVPS